MARHFGLNSSVAAISILILASLCLTNAAPNKGPQLDEDDEMFNKVFPYIPMKTAGSVESRADTEQSLSKSTNNVIPIEVDVRQEMPSTEESVDKTPSKLSPSTPNFDLIKTIVYNSREVRLVGPQEKEVDMKDDIGTKVVVAFENLQKEAKEVWGHVEKELDKGWKQVNVELDKGWKQVNAKLDQGWTQLKKMI